MDCKSVKINKKDSSAPSILPPQFESQAHHLHFFQFIMFNCIFSFELECAKNENKQKEA